MSFDLHTKKHHKDIKGCLFNKRKLHELSQAPGCANKDVRHLNMTMRLFVQEVIQKAVSNPDFNVKNGITKGDILYSLNSHATE